ncbi:MAG: ATP-dependent helicase, partial [Candidatus Marinimicrobia bacterium]|nr:ATP-dependent helicase [Candidatus Neomarinimicrobiota bacterium]
ESLIPFFNRMRDELIDPGKMEIPDIDEDGLMTAEIANQLRDIKNIYPQFQDWKKRINVVDYGDMILSAYELLKSDPLILKKVQDQFRHIIVDEFQDNNYALNEIISLVAGERKFITVVGDDDQVIYSFRGANSYNIQAFKDRYGHHPEFLPVSLEENFRSTQPILDIANESIKNNVDRMEKTLLSKVDTEPIMPVRFWGNKNEQVEFIVREILSLVEEGQKYSDIAVLCRTHSQSATIVHALNQAGIPVQTKWPSFFNISSIRDIIAWCQVIGNGTHQDSALYRIFEKQCGYETAHSLFHSFDKWDPTPRLEIIKSNNTLQSKFPSILPILASIQHFKDISPKRSAGEMLWGITEHLKILKTSAKKYDLDDHFVLLNVGDLLKRAQDFTRRNKSNHSLFSFNIYIEAMMTSGKLPSIQPSTYRHLEGVIVNTVHGVKGGEFPVVLLPFQRSGSFPLNFRSTKRISRPPDEWLAYAEKTDLTPKEHHYQEERRLFYVAVTRAQKKLYILTPEKSTSKFIKELPNTLMEDHPMTDPEKDLKTYSDLKIKYEQKLQKSLSRENYDQVKNYSDALALIDQHESGKKIELGDSDWETELKQDIAIQFEPGIQERINLSASAIETYKQCPLKFRLGRIDGVPQTASKPVLVFGNIIHRILQRFHEPDTELSEERILQLMDEEWKKGEFDYTVREEKFKEQGKEMLVRYCRMVQLNPPNVLAREESFAFDLGPITIRGAIDRIDQIGDGTAIVDYKTSKTSSSAKSNLQLAIYSMYLEQSDDPTLGGLPAEASLHFLRDEDKPLRSHSFTSDQVGETKEKIVEVAAGIRNREFDAKTGMHCDWCDYKSLVCPAWEDD